MGMVINTNVSSLTAQRHLAESRADMEQAMERLSSGQRINSAMDDAAGLTIAHSLDSKITSLNQAVRNANDGIALIQLAEGALDEVSAMLTRMKELATQALNGTYSDTDLTNLNKEYLAMADEIERISENTKFNGISVLNSTDSISFQVGDTSSDVISTTLARMGSAYIGGTGAFTSLSSNTQGAGPGWGELTGTAITENDVLNGTGFRLRLGEASFVSTTKQGLIDKVNAYFGATAAQDNDTDNFLEFHTDYVPVATVMKLESFTADDTGILASSSIIAGNEANALTILNNAIKDIDSHRATLGAIANRMEHASSNLMSRVENQSAARSRIQDADYAVESANLAKAQVLQQAGTAMLAQANASTQNILSLLK